MSNINFPVDMLMELVRQLPDELKQQLIQEWTEETKQKEAEELINMADYMPNIESLNKPIDLKKHAINFDAAQDLVDLWVDELPAEELCKMLTK